MLRITTALWILLLAALPGCWGGCTTLGAGPGVIHGLFLKDQPHVGDSVVFRTASSGVTGPVMDRAACGFAGTSDTFRLGLVNSDFSVELPYSLTPGCLDIALERGGTVISTESYDITRTEQFPNGGQCGPQTTNEATKRTNPCMSP